MTSGAADLNRIRTEVTAALTAFLALKRAELADIDQALLPNADAIADFLTGGKRLRPAFCYWGWRACGGSDGTPIFTAAAALELLHASALVHDDLMDASDTRRGKPSVHRRFEARHAAIGWNGSAERFGAGAAILIGDLLLAWTDEMLRRSDLPENSVARALDVLDSMRTEVLAGQFLDLVAQASGASDVDRALRVVVYKSAKYTVERPLHIGAALAGADLASSGPSERAGAPSPARTAGQVPVAEAFTSYGIGVGTAFQMRDDILGVFGDPTTTGKPVTDDLREGKRTVMLAIARQRADAAQAKTLDACVGDPDLTAQDAERVQTVITDTGALAECEQMIEANVQDALAALDGAPITDAARQALGELAVEATFRAR